jgi:hypothetical protein
VRCGQGQFEAADLRRWELTVLQTLEFSVSTPTIWDFVRRWRLTAEAEDSRVETLSESAVNQLICYFATRALLYTELVAQRPSKVANLAMRAAHYCVRAEASASGLYLPAAARQGEAARIAGMVERFLADVPSLTEYCERKQGTAIDRRWPLAASIRRKALAAAAPGQMPEPAPVACDSDRTDSVIPE